MGRIYHRRLRVIRLFCSVSVPILCSLLLVATPTAHAQKRATVTTELKRLQAEGADPTAIATYRAIYTVRFAGVVYVLHAFQKKSRRGIATPKAELDLIERRLKRAREDHERWSRSEEPIRTRRPKPRSP